MYAVRNRRRSLSTSSNKIPNRAQRTTLCPDIKTFLEKYPALSLGGEGDFHNERAHHLEVFGIHNLPKDKIHPIGQVEFTAIRGPHGTIPIRVLYPESGDDKRGNNDAGALIYFHGGGYTIGTVDEFENGLRLVAEEASVQVYAVEYHLAPEWRYPVQLDEYSAVIDALQSHFGSSRGVNPSRVLGGGDSAGGNMTAAIALRRRDESKRNIAAQILLYPEARLPFDTPAATENNTGLYLECNGIFSFADHYLSRGTAPSSKYVSPGVQPLEYLIGVPPVALFTSGFDPLRDVGVEYGHKLEKAGNEITWHHYETMAHGWLQMTPWSADAVDAVKDVGREVKRLAYMSRGKLPQSP